jgi:hypothetical protein
MIYDGEDRTPVKDTILLLAAPSIRLEISFNPESSTSERY